MKQTAIIGAAIVVMTAGIFILFFLDGDDAEGPGINRFPLRLLDQPEFIFQVKEASIGHLQQKSTELAAGGWRKVEGNGHGSIFATEVPADCPPYLQEYLSTPATLSSRGRELTFAASMEELRSMKEGWIFLTPRSISFHSFIMIGQTIEQELFLPVSGLEVEARFRNMAPGTSAFIGLDGKEASAKADNQGEAVVKGSFSGQPGINQLKAGIRGRGIQAAENAELVRVTVGSGNLVLVKAESSAPSSFTLNYGSLAAGRSAVFDAIRNQGTVVLDSEGFPGANQITKVRLQRSDPEYDDTVRAVSMFDGSELSYQAEIPAGGAELTFQTGWFAGPPQAKSALVVELSTDGENASRQSRAIPFELQHLKRESWKSHSVSLTEFAGRTVTIRFSYTSAGEKAGDRHLLLGEPMVLTTSSKKAERPNVILIVLDTMRGDHMALQGYEHDTTPFLDSLAEQGVLFRRAYSQAGWTLPSHASFLTGFYPLAVLQMGGKENFNTALPKSVPTAASYFKAAGYQTMALVNGGFVAAHYGMHSDFDSYLNYKENYGYEVEINGKRRIIKRDGWRPALEWMLERRGAEPFFYLLHSYNPHIPYSSFGFEDAFGQSSEDLPLDFADDLPGNAPARLVEHMRLVYDRNLRRTDQQLQAFFELLEHAGALENTYVFITSDHGELIGEHGLNGRHGPIWNGCVHVPLVVIGPEDIAEGTRVEERVELTDLLPTMLEVAELPIPGYLHGRSLKTFLSGGAPSGWQEALHAMSSMERVAITAGDIRYHLRDGAQLAFNMINDPGEQQNIAGQPGIQFPLLERFAYFYAQQFPGWNLLITPPQGERIRITLVDYDSKDSSLKESSNEWRLPGLRIVRNLDEVIVEKEPLLLLMDDHQGDSFVVSVEIERDGEWQPWPAKALIAFEETRENAQFLVEQSARSAAPPIQQGLSTEAVSEHQLLIWKTILPFSATGADAAQLGEEDIEALKDLGYLQ